MKKLLSIGLALCGVAILSLSSDAFARDRSHSGSYVTGKGKSETYATQRTGNLKTGVTKNKSVTTSTGETRSRIVQKQYDKETGAFSKTSTDAKGRSITSTGVAKDGVRTGTYTTSDGKTGTFNQAVTKGVDGVTTNTAVPTAAGKELNSSTTRSYDKATNTLNSSHTGVQGETHSGSVTVTPDK